MRYNAMQCDAMQCNAMQCNIYSWFHSVFLSTCVTVCGTLAYFVVTINMIKSEMTFNFVNIYNIDIYDQKLLWWCSVQVSSGDLKSKFR